MLGHVENQNFGFLMTRLISSVCDRNAELEAALLEECDFGSLRNICKGRPIPAHLRAEVWQVRAVLIMLIFLCNNIL